MATDVQTPQTLSPYRPEPRSADDLSRLVHLIYEAATRPQEWSAVVAAIGGSLGASKGLLFTPYVGPQDGGILFTWRLEEAAMQLWSSRYIEHDIWSIRARERNLWQEGAAFVNEDLVSDEDFRGSVFYNEFLSQLDIEWMCSGVVFAGAPGLPHTTTSFFRDRHAPAFTEQDKAWLRLLMTHLSRSLGLMHRLKALELRAATLSSALDRLAFGVGLLNGQRQVLHMNTVGWDVLARQDGLMLGPDRTLDSVTRQGELKLQQWLTGSAGAEPRDAPHFSEGFVVGRRAKDRQYFVQVTMLEASDDWEFDGEPVRCVVFITDPAATRLPPAERLSTLYALTRSEARVALELAEGKSQKEVAKALRISLSTARTHTQSIFVKLRIHRHADLVRMVLALGQVVA